MNADPQHWGQLTFFAISGCSLSGDFEIVDSNPLDKQKEEILQNQDNMSWLRSQFNFMIKVLKKGTAA
jgi:hypothetical protein